MKEISGDIWDYHDVGHWIVITTNGSVRKDDAAVIGMGVARQARQRFPKLPKELGNRIKGCSMAYGEWSQGNTLKIFHQYMIITFPVKNHWRDTASMSLI